jgi:hypothetical protein
MRCEDSEICCSGNCGQAKECPRYRKPAEPSATVWIVDTLCVCALVLIVWGIAAYGNSFKAWLWS